MTDTNTGSDWSSVNFATPAGPNDVGVGVVDSDGDGIPDSAKINGKTFAGLDLYAMGARPGQRDVFMQIDSMNSNDPGIILRPEAAQKLVDTFANKVYSAGKKKLHYILMQVIYSRRQSIRERSTLVAVNPSLTHRVW
jgi:hypothetical protein